jgi:hypothetical protein
MDQTLKQDFRIAGGFEFDSLAFEFAAYLPIVVDFTVVNEAVPAIGIPKGLTAARVEIQER